MELSPVAAICGDYCGKCPHYPDKCGGCTPQTKAECRFVICCTARDLEHCGYCPEFPCESLSEFCPDDRPGCPPGYHIENLRRRMAIGIQAWLAEQRQRWGR